MVNLKQDTARIEERDMSQIYSVRPSKENMNVFHITAKKKKNYNTTPINA